MESSSIVKDLAVILGTAGLVTLLFRTIRQPVVLGYILAGIFVGPLAPRPLVSDLQNVRTWAEFGVIFLMFALGLEFNFRKLKRVGVRAIGTALIEVSAMFALGYGVGHFLGWNPRDCLFLAGMLCVSSTTIIVKSLHSLGFEHRRFAEVILGILIVEDLVAIVLLVSLSAGSGSMASISGWSVAYAALKLIFIVGSWFLIGYFLIPSFIRRASRHMDDETITVLATGFCLVMVATAHAFHYSAALGAFIMGSLLGETEEAERIHALIQPVKNLFAAVFFVTVGILVQPAAVQAHFPTILLLTAVVLVGKMTSAFMGALLSGELPRTSLQIGFSLANIGEFSFIMAALGTSLGSLQPLYPIAVGVSLLTTFLAPYLIRSAERLGVALEKQLPPRLFIGIMRHSEKMRNAVLFDPTEKVIYAQMARFVGSGVVLTLIFIFGKTVGIPRLEDWLPTSEHRSLVAWIAVLLLSAPFVWGMYFAFRTPEHASQRLPSPRAFQGLSPFFGRLATLAWIGALSHLYFRPGTSLFIVLIPAIILGVRFYRRLETTYRWMERTLVSNVNPRRGQQTTKFDALAPWDLHLARLTVHPNSPLAGKSIEEAKVRKAFAVNIVMIHRGERLISPPAGAESLMPHDLLLVLGNDDQLDRFQEKIGKSGLTEFTRGHLSDFSLRRIAVDESSHLKDQTIKEARLREVAGMLIVGIERGHEKIANPSAETLIRMGDVLVTVSRSG